jgi:hypothetical protein
MPVYLDTRGNSVLSVAICDRCSRKFAYTDLMPDPNFPGMRVCAADRDNFDPWRLPARQTENIALRFPRPDVSVATGPNLLNTQGNANDPQQYDNFTLEGILPAAGAQGNLNTMSNTAAPVRASVSEITPNSGSRAGGYTATIGGDNFRNVSNVLIGGVPTSFTVLNENSISVTIPAYGLPGSVEVVVTTNVDSAIALNLFTYT